MLHFIPAWYQQNDWHENEQNWHVRRTQTEFDDTVKQIQLFQRSGEYVYQILLLSFTPNLRHFLHRQGVYRAPYWSCFDAIQEIRRKKVMTLSYHNLKWPDGIEFIYTPFVLVAMLAGEKYAQIEFGEDGNLIQIDMYQNGILCRRNYYDDRGFVSVTVICEGEKVVYWDYLMENGIWKIRRFKEDGHVEVNPKYSDYLLCHMEQERTKSFAHLRYASMEEVIEEVFASYLNMLDPEDLFCIAMHTQHMNIMQKTMRKRKYVVSFYGNRYEFTNREAGMKLIASANYLITDSDETTRTVCEEFRQENGLEICSITDISPFDTRLDFSISNQLHVQNVMVPVDELDESLFEELIYQLGIYLTMNENARVCLFTRTAYFDQGAVILEKVRGYLTQYGLRSEWARERDESHSENRLEETQKEPIRIYVEQCVDELSVSKCMKEQRILVDLRDIPELYLQILAVSIGIPQIVRTRTQYVKQNGNGMVLQEIQDLPLSLEHYLAGMKNWNEARVFSYELSKKYTTSVLLDKWKEVIDIIG